MRRHLGIRDNFAFAGVDEDRRRAPVHEMAAADPQGIVVPCTNLCGAPLAAELEAQTGITLYDSVATVNWMALQLAGIDPARVRGWGRLLGAEP